MKFFCSKLKNKFEIDAYLLILYLSLALYLSIVVPILLFGGK